MKTFKQYVDEVVGKFMTGEVGIKGKRVKVEVEVSGVDNKKRIRKRKKGIKSENIFTVSRRSKF